MQNLFHPGDNLDGLQRVAELGIKVDLVYIDPPFATNNEFLIDTDRANSVSRSGQLAYSDTTVGAKYLDELKARLQAISFVMNPTGSVYVHIDVNMEHHVRLLMDQVFGPENFRNSITRIKCNPKNFARYSYGNIRDTILFYSVSPRQITWHPQRVPMSDSEIASLYPLTDDEGRRYATTPVHAPGTTVNGATSEPWRGMLPPVGRHWRNPPDKLEELDEAGLIAWSSTGNPRKISYADESAGKLPQDLWCYKDPERPVYPTQKNAGMLERIILTSSNPADTVLDCYAGNGTTLIQAAQLGRRFIGMDNSPAARAVIQRQMADYGIEYDALIDLDQHVGPFRGQWLMAGASIESV